MDYIYIFQNEITKLKHLKDV